MTTPPLSHGHRALVLLATDLADQLSFASVSPKRAPCLDGVGYLTIVSLEWTSLMGCRPSTWRHEYATATTIPWAYDTCPFDPKVALRKRSIDPVIGLLIVHPKPRDPRVPMLAVFGRIDDVRTRNR